MKVSFSRPKELFNNYVINKITRADLLDSLLFILENDNSPSIRSESLRIIQEVGSKDEKVYDVIEGSLISDESSFVRAAALDVLCRNFSDRCENPFFWLVQNETSAIVLMPLLKYMEKIPNEKFIEYKDMILRKYASIYGVVIDEAEFFLEWEYLYSGNNEDGKYVKIGWFLEEKTNFLYFVKHGEGSNFRSFAVKEHHVIALNFIQHILGKVPETIQTLKYLKYLNIHRVKEIPDFLKNNPNLRELYITGPFLKEMPDWLLLKIKKKYIFPYIVEGVNYENAMVLGLFEYFMGEKLIKIPISYDIRNKDYGSEYKISKKGDVIGIYINRGIGTLPIEIRALRSLKELILTGSSIDLIPDSIGELTSLHYLVLNCGNIKKIPKSLCNMTSLEYIDLSQNNLDKIPKSLCNMTSLEYIDLNQNNIDKIPKYIDKLKSLKFLNLGWNHISEISEICNINSLEELILQDNEIKEIPEAITRLENLKFLDLSQNPIVELPDTIKAFVRSLDGYCLNDELL